MANIVVLGAGVVGLSTALRLQESGYAVTIIAEHFPGDKKTIEYTSPWAGAHHRTFEVMWKMSEPGHPAAGCFMRLPQTEIFVKQPSETYSCYEYMPGHRLTNDEANSKVTVEFETITIDTAVYLPYLFTSFLGKGGRVVRARVGHISQVALGSYTPKPDLIVVCAGIGARSLGGIEDKDVFPIRGQIALIRAPWIKFGISEKTPERFCYIIPRQSGDVVIGGTYGINDWYPHPRPETVDEIIKNTLSLSQLIAPPEARENGRTPTMDDVKRIIIESGCGLRPGRKGGIRLEASEISYFEDQKEKKLPLVLNYGIFADMAGKVINRLGAPPNPL
ncbi:FAD-dependent oxidoreductase [Ceratobasidium sp. AG-Ba]|nr:FAD-dependent oxidoreductase [Ceratobasidium sp. AG-Ba]